jgi:hypothetical protein
MTATASGRIAPRLLTLGKATTKNTKITKKRVHHEGREERKVINPGVPGLKPS